MNWNWDNFRFFLALAEKHTLIAAAAELEVSHTTVLRRIKAFEAQLGAQLFTHSPDGYKLTDKGHELHKQANLLKTSVDSITRSVVGADNEISGKITLTTPDTIGYQLMPDILARLTAQYPALRIELLIQNHITDITRLEAEVAIRTGFNPPPDLIGKKLGKLKFCLCASDEYLKHKPVDHLPDNLQQHRFITLSGKFDKAVFNHWLLNQIPTERSEIVADGLMSALQLCRKGCGITVLPEYLASRDPCLVTINSTEPAPANDVWLLSHKDLRNSAKIKALKQFLAQELKPVFSV